MFSKLCSNNFNETVGQSGHEVTQQCCQPTQIYSCLGNWDPIPKAIFFISGKLNEEFTIIKSNYKVFKCDVFETTLSTFYRIPALLDAAKLKSNLSDDTN